ncbi:hypothetical protein [Pseudodesulfovibrio senegalensis]|uniref:Uncharacterized protein n=1 Tax=Pseudodesulfovibrio senegalensis TaxID=1721087 RepID=A0A6N6N144_9BACT|nr:hypothetical protein [Pseudodesulfovibrio senegalensis]KAB1440263.1 hypothetical protein F8A88_13505 [Pseudodesulfovibrio senegalensis]
MSTQLFSLRYAGTAIVNGEMEAKDVAPAIDAIGAVFAEASKVLTDNQVSSSIRIRSAIKKKSIDLGFIAEIIEKAQPLIDLAVDDPGFTAKMLWKSIKGATKALKWLKGRRYQTEKKGNEVVIRTPDGDERTVDSSVVVLLKNFKIRALLYKIIGRPLESDGIDTSSISGEGEEPITVTKKEAEYYYPPPPSDEDILEDEREEFLTVVTPQFEEKYKWRFSDGRTTFNATVKDGVFQKRISESKELFGKGSILAVRLRVIQRIEKGTLKTDYEVLRVKRHTPPQQQGSLFDEH